MGGMNSSNDCTHLSPLPGNNVVNILIFYLRFEVSLYLSHKINQNALVLGTVACTSTGLLHTFHLWNNFILLYIREMRHDISYQIMSYFLKKVGGRVLPLYQLKCYQVSKLSIMQEKYCTVPSDCKQILTYHSNSSSLSMASRYTIVYFQNSFAHIKSVCKERLQDPIPVKLLTKLICLLSLATVPKGVSWQCLKWALDYDSLCKKIKGVAINF